MFWCEREKEKQACARPVFLSKPWNDRGIWTTWDHPELLPHCHQSDAKWLQKSQLVRLQKNYDDTQILSTFMNKKKKNVKY